MNLEVQLLLKQGQVSLRLLVFHNCFFVCLLACFEKLKPFHFVGQVEVAPGSFITDYTESALIHRSVVEDLNAQITVRICSLGEGMGIDSVVPKSIPNNLQKWLRTIVLFK